MAIARNQLLTHFQVDTAPDAWHIVSINFPKGGDNMNETKLVRLLNKAMNWNRLTDREINWLTDQLPALLEED